MSRTNKILKNAKVSTFYFVLVTFIGFYSRSIFLDKLGDDFIGLTATLGSFLSFLNLAELGVGTAMGFAMYNSLFNKNHVKINELFNLIGFLYNRIGKIVLTLGIILSLFFPLIFAKTSINTLIIYYVFYIYLIGSLIYYFQNYHLMLLQADQKGYIPTAYKQTLHISKILIQIGLLQFSNSFTLFISIELISIIIFNILLHKRIKKEYPWLKLSYSSQSNKSILDKNKDLILKIKQVFVHRITRFILKSTDNIVIFSFTSLQTVAFIGNYHILIGSSTTLLTNFLSGTTAAVGSLVAENDKTKIKKVFWELMSLNHYVGGLLVLSLYYGMDPVILLWLGEQYVMESHIVLLLLANVFIMKMRVPMDEFINAYGMFHDIWAPITEGILNLAISIILATYFGVAGVLIGTLVSVSIIALGWKPYFLYTKGFKQSVFDYWRGFFILVFSFLLAFIICNYIINTFLETQVHTWWLLILSLSKIGIIIAIIYTAVMYFFNKGFRTLSLRFLNIFKNIIKRN